MVKLDIEMPESCRECELTTHELDYENDYSGVVKEYECCAYTGERTEDYYEKRREDCPLIEVKKMKFKRKTGKRKNSIRLTKPNHSRINYISICIACRGFDACTDPEKGLKATCPNEQYDKYNAVMKGEPNES